MGESCFTRRATRAGSLSLATSVCWTEQRLGSHKGWTGTHLKTLFTSCEKIFIIQPCIFALLTKREVKMLCQKIELPSE